jgi:hypothetical protein
VRFFRFSSMPHGAGAIALPKKAADVRQLTPWVIVVAVGLAYPLAVLAGGAPRFPSRDECVHPATRDGDIDAVFGYFDSQREAERLRERALEVGFQGTEIELNACGRVRVALGGIPTLEVGRDLAEEARPVGFQVTLEQAG